MKYCVGVELLEVIGDTENPKDNRGFGFIDFYNHACAEK